jgi:hypothetical protein
VIFLSRHGETAGNTLRIVQRPDIPLSPRRNLAVRTSGVRRPSTALEREIVADGADPPRDAVHHLVDLLSRDAERRRQRDHVPDRQRAHDQAVLEAARGDRLAWARTGGGSRGRP